MVGPEVTSRMTLSEAMDGRHITDPVLREAHEALRPYMTLIDLPFFGFDGRLKIGQAVVHEQTQDFTYGLFTDLMEIRYPIEKMQPHVVYENDLAAEIDNNTSSFRVDWIGDPTKRLMTEHARFAFDINPAHNEMRFFDGHIEPDMPADFVLRQDAVIDDPANSEVIDIFHKMRKINGQDVRCEYGGHWNIGGTIDFYGRKVVQDRHHIEIFSPYVGVLTVPEGIWPAAA